ncbi:MAG: ABC transporter permease [Desulfuromonas sp.]|nr:ABC transporter permease [Desulfuromonas sp.]
MYYDEDNMFRTLKLLTYHELLRIKRDRVFWSFAGVALLLLFMTPIVANLSMRQPAQTGFTLSYSLVHLFLLVLTVFLGTQALSRAIERRTLIPVLTLPFSRSQYLLGAYLALAIVILVCALCLDSISLMTSMWLAQFSPIDAGLSVKAMLVAYAMGLTKYLLLLAWALFFSVFSTSFFLPVFGTLGVYIAGSATYQIVEYLLSNPAEYSQGFILLVKVLLYILPNFHAFDFQVYAAYGLAVPWMDVIWALGYGLTYSTVILYLATFCFMRREL